MSSLVDLTTFRRLQTTLVCPICDNTGTIQEIDSPTRSPKFKCTNPKCISKSITPKQVADAMKKKPGKKRHHPSSTTECDNLQQPHQAMDIPTNTTETTTTSAFEHHPALPDFMTNIIAQLNEVREEQRKFKEEQRMYKEQQLLGRQEQEQLAKAIQELQQLKQDLVEKDNIITQQQKMIEELRNGTQATTTTNDSSASKHAPQGEWANNTKVQQLRAVLSEGPQSTTMRKQQAAARIFSPPSNNQGFQHIYLPTRARLRISQIRQNLRKLHIDNNRVLDINYPAMNTTSLLVHNDFVEELVDRLRKAGITPLDSFVPTDHQHLRDPKYADHSVTDRQDIAFNLHQQRMLRSIDFIRAPAKFAVAKCFARQGWITEEQLTSVLHSLDSSPTTSAFITNDEPTDMESDDVMESTNNSNNHTSSDDYQ